MPARAEYPAEQLATALRFYRQAMREALIDEDFHPVMPAATWLLLSVAREPGTVGQVARRLGTSKQAVSRLAERLVGLGYCDRRRGDVRIAIDRSNDDTLWPQATCVVCRGRSIIHGHTPSPWTRVHSLGRRDSTL